MKSKKLIFLLPLLIFSVTSGCAKQGSQEMRHFSLVTTTEQTSAETSETLETQNRLSASSAGTVYITKSGKRYHYSKECGGDKCFECELNEALEKGLTPCKKCVK